jgi:hypothetical protein
VSLWLSHEAGLPGSGESCCIAGWKKANPKNSTYFIWVWYYSLAHGAPLVVLSGVDDKIKVSVKLDPVINYLCEVAAAQAGLSKMKWIAALIERELRKQGNLK